MRVLPASSVAVQTTDVVSPTSNDDPDSGSHSTIGASVFSSCAVFVHVTVVSDVVLSVGHVIVGFC